MEIVNGLFWLIVSFSFLTWLIVRIVGEEESRHTASELAWETEGK